MVTAAQALSTGDLATGYRVEGGFDELIDAVGSLRPHWHDFLRAIAALDPATLALRMEQLNVRVRETGIAHDIYADPASTAQPWRVDLVPLIVAPEEWRRLERALLQRARLFAKLLADLYGPQRLLASGAIPHQLVFSDRRSCGRAMASIPPAARSSSLPPTWHEARMAAGA